MKNSFAKGMSIVEIVVAAGIIATCVTGIVGAIQIYLKLVHQNAREAQAVLILDETAEVLQYLRDISYQTYIADLDTGVEYTVFWDGNTYTLSTSTTVLPYDMTSHVVFEDVRRDTGTDQIVSSGGIVDSNTKKAIITVTWPYQNEIKNLTSEMLIHNMYEN